ncbi:MAG: helix-turn-helix transcriptional regulator [Mariniphaga sp.]|nr:helix-turn-helix transcriptional regulator [Mariniphaga sp.]
MNSFCFSFVEKASMNIGIVIKEIRKQKGLTQLDLSEKTKISERTIQRIEKDAVEPSLYSLKQISEILEVDLLKIKNKNSMTFINKLLGINLKDNIMTTEEKVDIEERLRKIESHLVSIDRTYKWNRKTVKGVLFATGIITVCILGAWIIWMLINMYTTSI